eukprot:c21835_g2_i2 orf=243-941(+)
MAQEKKYWSSIDVGSHSSLQRSELEWEVCENPWVLSVLSSLLEKVVASNQRFIAGSDRLHSRRKVTVFDGLRAPDISIHSYIQRIFKYANCSLSCYVAAYVYIDRFTQEQLDIPITCLNVHRLLITSVMVAAKFFDDAYYNNAYYAKVGGVTRLEMNRLELEFLFKLDFRLHVTVNTFEDYCSQLQKEVAVGGRQKVERTLKLVCSFDEVSAEEGPQKQSALPVLCTYGAVQ